MPVQHAPTTRAHLPLFSVSPTTTIFMQHTPPTPTPPHTQKQQQALDRQHAALQRQQAQLDIHTHELEEQRTALNQQHAALEERKQELLDLETRLAARQAQLEQQAVHLQQLAASAGRGDGMASGDGANTPTAGGRPRMLGGLVQSVLKLV